jgi:archaellum component FlaC
VTNIDTLIENLAGKFLTSIVAIFCAIVLSSLEIGWFRRIRALQHAIYRDVDRLLPQLSQIVLLRDLQHDALQRTVSISTISSEVVDRFASVFSTSLLPAFAENVRGELEPTLARLSESMDSMRGAIQRLEGQKQESVVGEFRMLAAGIETTLRTSMEQMGRDFTASLSGSASSEFDSAAKALGASAEVLSGLNSSFTQMRESLDQVVLEARRATEEQLTNGTQRAEALNTLVEQLLLRLNDSATGSAERIHQLLAESVGNMQIQLGQLSEQLTTAVADATANATTASTSVMESATAAARLTQSDAALLASRLESALERMEGAGDSLGAAQRTVRETIDHSGAVLKQYEHVSADLRMSSVALAGAAASAREAQEAMRGTMGKAGESISQLDALARRQQETLERQAATLQQVHTIFDGLDEQLSAVLGVVTERLQQHNRSLEQNFEAILRTVNKEVPKVSNSLFSATTELSEQVSELSGVLDQLRQALRDRDKK